MSRSQVICDSVFRRNSGSSEQLSFSIFSTEFDSWVTIGMDGVCRLFRRSSACNYDSAATNDDGPVNTCRFRGWFRTVSGEDQRTIGQFNTRRRFLSGQVNVQMFTDGNDLTINDGISATCECFGEETLEGCTNLDACNYSSDANVDDGSCEFAENFCTACDGTCIQDTDGDGVCDCVEFPGCTDELACNYDPIYTDDAGNCYYAELHYDCDDNCLEDSDGDGVCDPLEVPGCTDDTFCNYNPQATDDDGSCGETDQVNDACTGAWNSHVARACS